MASSHTARLRQDILRDMLGESFEAYESFKKAPREASGKRQHRQRIPLWRFLLHLLRHDTQGAYIGWTQSISDLEFKIKDPAAVATLWGSIKDKSSMTYEKLGRAMRYYYGKNIIEKVSSKRYSYRFIISAKTKKYITEVLQCAPSECTWQPSDMMPMVDDVRRTKTLSRLESCSSSMDECSSYDTGSDSGISASGVSSLSSSWSNDEFAREMSIPERYIFEEKDTSSPLDAYFDDDYDDDDADDEEDEDRVAECLARSDAPCYRGTVVCPLPLSGKDAVWAGDTYSHQQPAKGDPFLSNYNNDWAPSICDQFDLDMVLSEYEACESEK